MLLSTLSSLGFTVILSVVHATISDASVATNWTNPNANLASFSSTYLNGERIILSWLALNESTDDLWLTRYDTSTDTFALRIASQIDISVPGSFTWQVAVNNDEVLKDTRFVLQFQPTGINYDGSTQSNLTSPAFNLMLVNQASPPNGTASAGPTSASPATATMTSLSPTTTSTTSGPNIPLPSDPAKHDSGISTGLIGGLAAALAVIGIAGFGIGYWWFKRRQKHKDQKKVGQAEVDMQGPYEILADRRHPTELNSKETDIHEMMNSRETIGTEIDSPIVHEVSNTVKRPGLHEMPG